jgi:hypothetical protein
VSSDAADLSILLPGARRSREEVEYELIDTGVFDDDRYFDVFVEYAKERQTGWTGLMAAFLDLFGRLDAKTVLETEGERLRARVVREQVAGSSSG